MFKELDVGCFHSMFDVERSMLDVQGVRCSGSLAVFRVFLNSVEG